MSWLHRLFCPAPKPSPPAKKVKKVKRPVLTVTSISSDVDGQVNVTLRVDREDDDVPLSRLSLYSGYVVLPATGPLANARVGDEYLLCAMLENRR